MKCQTKQGSILFTQNAFNLTAHQCRFQYKNSLIIASVITEARGRLTASGDQPAMMVTDRSHQVNAATEFMRIYRRSSGRNLVQEMS